MAKTISNVLVGEASLYIKNPFDESKAEWSTADRHQGTYSVKLTKGSGGTNGGTGIKFCPPGITLGTWNTQVNTALLYQFWFRNQETVGIRNWVQWGFRFDDPNSNGHAEITVYPYHSIAGDNIWTLCDLGALAEAVTPAPAASYGANEVGTRVDTWGGGLHTDTIRAAIGNGCVVAADDSADDWVLSWVKINLWEGEDARYSYIDEIKIHGVSYTVEPGGDLPALELENPYTEVGYTEDGFIMEYTQTSNKIRVMEETFPVANPITAEDLSIKGNLAEASLYNLDVAMGGASLSGNVITLGGGVQKELALKLVGTSPEGYHRTIFVPKAVAVGAVAMPFKKGEKSVVPVAFEALKESGVAPALIVDNDA